jgi:hypothetical protein
VTPHPRACVGGRPICADVFEGRREPPVGKRGRGRDNGRAAGHEALWKAIGGQRPDDGVLKWERHDLGRTATGRRRRTAEERPTIASGGRRTPGGRDEAIRWACCASFPPRRRVADDTDSDRPAHPIVGIVFIRRLAIVHMHTRNASC